MSGIWGGDVAISGPLKLPIASLRAHLSPDEPASFPDGPLAVGLVAVKDRVLGCYPATKGRPGGKLPTGKRASRSPCFNFSAAERKAATNQEYIS